jgi:hypothetical protein
LFRSTNGGNSWGKISTLKDNLVHHLAINPKNSSILYVGALDTVYKSIDSGGSGCLDSFPKELSVILQS